MVKTMEHSYTEEDLFKAVKNNYFTTVQRIIKAGVNVNAQNSHGATPLHEAALFNNGTKIVKALIDAGANINAQDKELFTPLHIACKPANDPWSSAKVHALIDGGADIHAKTLEGRTPLYYAYTTDLITILLQHGAKVDEQDNKGQTRLHRACEHGSIDALRTLIKAGADVKKNCDRYPHTPVGYAIIGYQLSQLEYSTEWVNGVLRQTGCAPWEKENVRSQQDQVMLTLLSHGSPIDTDQSEEIDYFFKHTLSLIGRWKYYGYSSMYASAWINIFNSFSPVLDDEIKGEKAKKVIENLANAWPKIKLNSIDFMGKKVGDISKIIADLYNVIEFCDGNKDKYRESNPELYESLQKIIPGLEESVDVFKSHKTDLILEHIGSEMTLSEFKGRIKFCISQCNSFKDTNFLKDFITDYLDQNDEFINEITIPHQDLTHLGNNS